MTVFAVEEATTRLYTTSLLDETGTPFNGGAFLTLVLTLYDLGTDTIINSRNAQNVLNLNGVTVTTGGVLTWVLAPEDTGLVNSALPYELHRALFTGTWNPGGGVRIWRHEVTFRIRNLSHVP